MLILLAFYSAIIWRRVMGAVLLTLAIIFTQLSLIAFGGGNTILPEMQRQVVDIHH